MKEKIETMFADACVSLHVSAFFVGKAASAKISDIHTTHNAPSR
jgi:hypothetical protein